MNQQVVCVALAFVALFGVASAAEISESVRANLDILKAGEGSTPVGFEATHAALKAIHEELSNTPDLGFGSFILSDMAKGAVMACELDKARCEKNLSNLTFYLRGEPTMMTANLVPYLRECLRRQEEFCA